MLNEVPGTVCDTAVSNDGTESGAIIEEVMAAIVCTSICMIQTIVLLILTLLAGCDQVLRVSEYSRIRMGTRARIVLYAQSEAVASEAADAAFTRIEAIEAVLSDWRSESETVSLRQAAPRVWHAVSDDLDQAIQIGHAVWESTGGAFDFACGEMTASWRRSSGLGEPPVEWTEMFADAGPPGARIRVRPGALWFEAPVPWLDFGGIGKGLAADAALETLRAYGVSSALVDIGGDLAIGASPPSHTGWAIHRSNGLPTLHLSGCGVATSGSSEQHTGGRSHILDPRSGQWMPLHSDITIVAPTAAEADALASAACVLGADSLRAALGGREGIVVLPGALSKPTPACQGDSSEQ